jgi:Na+-transporting NADH:ubiquinone oxidoreductase subunit A
MSQIIKIKRGLDIKLSGKAEKILSRIENAEYYAVKPTDFHGVVPKLMVKVDDEVKAGTPLFHDKYKPEIVFTSPVSGKVESITRGDRRGILEVVIRATGEIERESFENGNPLDMSNEDIISRLLKSGIWPSIKQRPYNIIANPTDRPKSIFVSAIDSSPLGVDYDFLIKGQESAFQVGLNALSKLTSGKVHLNLLAGAPAAEAFSKAQNVQVNYFSGPHPVGNPGVQIHHLDPVNKGETVWVVQPQDVAIIGRLFDQGVYDASITIALAGSEVKTPRYYKIIKGAQIKSITQEKIQEGDNRYISGNVLTGTKVAPDGYLGYYDQLITVIPEGKYHEFIGWATPGFGKFSASRAFFSWLTPKKEFRLDTNYHGGERAYVMTGQYEKVFPFDIYPVHLIKAIMIEDIDLMERLGIYEIAEEDFALCEFVCTSKIEVQSIIRKGLDLMAKEMN